MPTFSPPSPHYIPPIRCPKCGGDAPLVRRSPDAFKRDGKTEIRTFECTSCGEQTAVTVTA